jgi:hypothetical protein
MLERINLVDVLQRVETYTKTGVCVIQQEKQWVELYFEEGRLMCVGPIRTNTTLGDRLVEDGVISPQALQEALLCMGTAEPSEMRMALTLMDLGYVEREVLRAWSQQQVIRVLRMLLTWSTGAIYFEESVTPPSDRLLVALSITSLLSDSPVADVLSYTNNGADRTIYPAPNTMQEQQESGVSSPHMANALTLFDASQLFSDTPPPATASPSSQESSFGFPTGADPSVPGPAQHMASSALPKPINTSFMRPDMVLVPADFPMLPDQNSQLALTPEQWRLLTRADGRTSLQAACQLLGWQPQMVCRVAGELIAQGLLHVIAPTSHYLQELVPASQPLGAFGSNNASRDSTTHSARPTVASPTPEPGVLPQYSPVLSFETQSQWGNGEKGATFVPGRGWVTISSPLQSDGPTPAHNASYAFAGAGGRQ